MIIQFNTDHHIEGKEKVVEYFSDLINYELSRFDQHITRIELHLSDENGKKTSINDIKCVMEARLEGIKPFAVTSHADTVEKAIEAALKKLEHGLDTKLGKLYSH